ncbi:MAG: aspartyl protease family protein [Opitutaceae bacterium]|nr:aspartyl protease family protein [Opitutaceae bacterium]
MSRFTRWIWPLPLLAISAALHGQPAADAKLQATYDAHDWFALRAAVDERSPSFFRGAIAVAFHDQENARRHLEVAIAAAPASDQAWEAQNLLVSLAFRAGAHRDAFARLDAMLRQRPADAGVANALPLAAALAASPDQAVLRRTGVRLDPSGTRGGHFLPIAINGKPARYVLDTGANFSVMTESEARRCGLTVRDAATKIANVGGTAIGLRAAVADEVTLGDARLAHVAFLVFRDDQQPFDEMAPAERGAIGLPVLLALQTLRLHRDGAIDLGFPSASADATPTPPNLAFDNLHPIARAECAGQPLTLIVDTGARTTQLWPPFARAFPALMAQAGAEQAHAVAGVGATQSVRAATLPEVTLRLGGFPATLKPARVHLKESSAQSHYFAGNLGRDLLGQAARATVDFATMRLTIE